MSEPQHGSEEADDTGSEDWKSQTKAIERVVSVALTMNEAKTAGWVAEEAHVSETTARSHLKLLADDLGILVSTTVGGVTKYRPDEAYTRFLEISRCVQEHSQEELNETLQKLREQQEQFEEKYDVDTPEQLFEKAAEDDVSAKQTREYGQAASEWETVEYELSIVKRALADYQEYSRTSTVKI